MTMKLYGSISRRTDNTLAELHGRYNVLIKNLYEGAPQGFNPKAATISIRIFWLPRFYPDRTEMYDVQCCMASIKNAVRTNPMQKSEDFEGKKVAIADLIPKHSVPPNYDAEDDYRPKYGGWHDEEQLKHAAEIGMFNRCYADEETIRLQDREYEQDLAEYEKMKGTNLPIRTITNPVETAVKLENARHRLNSVHIDVDDILSSIGDDGPIDINSILNSI